MISPDHWPLRDTRELLDYAVDWTKRLAGDKVVTSDVTLVTPCGLVLDDTSFTETRTTVWLRGGEVGLAEILCVVTTEAGRTLDELVKIQCVIYDPA